MLDDTIAPPRTVLIQSKWLTVLLPFGLAITLPIPRRRQLILARRRLDEDELRHEYCHAWQVVDWGSRHYLWRHIWARIKSRSLTAPMSEVEFPCYKAQYPHMSDIELEEYLLDG